MAPAALAGKRPRASAAGQAGVPGQLKGLILEEGCRVQRAGLCFGVPSWSTPVPITNIG